VWVPKTSHADNHYLDCEVYAAAAADIAGYRAITSAEARGENVQEAEKHAADTAIDAWSSGGDWSAENTESW
jgi:phage terminase large subunit GpA-like protein